MTSDVIELEGLGLEVTECDYCVEIRIADTLERLPDLQPAVMV